MPITPDVLARHGLKEDEYARILGRGGEGMAVHAQGPVAGVEVEIAEPVVSARDEVPGGLLRLHGAAMAVLVAACWWPAQLARPGAALLAASGALLMYNLWRAARLAWAVPAPK